MMRNRDYPGSFAVEASDYKKEKNYWLNKLSGDLQKSSFPRDYSKKGVKESHMETVPTRFTGELFSRIMKVSRNSDYIIHMIFIAGVAALLYRYTGNKDVIVGVPIYEQENEADFLNTVLPLRIQLENRTSFKELLLQVKQTMVEANENQNYPVETLLFHLNIPFSENEEFPLFDAAILLENIHNKKYIQHTCPNIIFSFLKVDDSVGGVVEYNSLLYERHTVEGILCHFNSLMEGAIFNVDMPVSRVDMLTVEEKRQLLEDFNDTRVDYPAAKTIDEIFAEQAAGTPGGVALTYEGEPMTYKQLHEETNVMAAYLRFRGVKPDEPVALIVENSYKVVVALLGILKAGGAYVPINVDYPDERKKMIVKDCRAKLLLTNCRQTYDFIPASSVIDVDDSSIYQYKFAGPKSVVPVNARRHRSDNLAYIIYTSGSTGTPKGVMVVHRNVVRLVKNTDFVRFEEGDSILLTGALEFDASTFEIWGALLNGLTLHLVSKETILNLDLLKQSTTATGVTTMWMTSPLFNQVLDADPGIFRGLKNLLVGGDVLSPAHIRRVRSRFPSLKVINGYGPTENTTFSTTFLVDKDYEESIPIGSPINNSFAYILDAGDLLVPIGVAGELYVGGDGLSRGYLNNPELTAEKFILLGNHEATKDTKEHEENNETFLRGSRGQFFQKEPPGRRRLYNTGDLARWLVDGSIEFLGRIDHQVKIRGFRIEPGEIENRLMQIDFVKEAVVTHRKNLDGEKYLCAYVVPGEESGDGFDIVELRRLLSLQFPDYMVPAYFVQLDEIPLTFNGKVDRKKLPEPEVSDFGSAYVAPRDIVEEKFVEIWAEVLRVEKEKIGIDADFFELGGHSLKATVVISKLHKAFNVKIPLAELFKTPTIRELAEFVRGLSAFEDRFLSIQPVETKEYYPLSSAQKRLYILQQMDLEGTSYNIPDSVVLEGALDKEKLGNTFEALIKYHESLRTSFEIIKEIPVQIIHDDVEFKIEYFDLATDRKIQHSTFNIQHSFVRPFDLSQAPLLRVSLVREAETRHILMVDMHHIITDGTSIDLFLREFTAIYADRQLLSLKLQYKDYAYWQGSEKQQEAIKRQEVYWLKRFAGEIPVLDLPIDYSRPAVQSFEGQTLTFEFSLEYTRGINDLALHTGTTLYMVLLAIYNILLSKLSSQEDIVVGTPTAARRHVDLERIIGMFVNTLAMRNYPVSDRTFTDFLSELKTSTLEAFENQEYQFEDLVDKVVVNRDISRNPLFDVVFSLPNMEAQVEGISPVEVPGLKVSPYKSENRTAKFDLVLACVESESEDRLFFTYEYCTKLFRKETIEKFVVYLKKIANTVIQNPSINIADIEIITEQEKRQVLYEFNDTAVDYPKDKTLHRLFEEQAEKTPDGVAVIGVERRAESVEQLQITYWELNEKSNQLAYYLIEKGVQPDTVVGLMVAPCIHLMIGIMGILKTGGAYLPIDPETPQKRIEYILKDSNAALLLTSGELSDVGRGTSRGKKYFAPTATCNLHLSLAYIIYTSGSTGRPKGTAVEHCQLVNFVYHMVNRYDGNVDYNDRCLSLTNIMFDVSVWEFFLPLLFGAQLVLLAEQKRFDVFALAEAIFREEITLIYIPPGLLRSVNEQLKKQRSRLRLNKMLVGVEPIRDEVLEDYMRLNPHMKIINGYGPTETTICASSLNYVSHPPEGEIVPIGSPLSNNQIVLLDAADRLVPRGVPGEICISGDGVSRGYINNPELTAEKYSPHPYFKGQRMYRTGDLARWLPEGNIRFIGRRDQQVKIRGYRVELGEIENRLLRHPDVKQALVLSRTHETAGKYLCAYIVSEKEFKTVDLRKWLSNYLPDYMIPSHFVQLDRLPLNPNGKVDIKALPEPVLKTGEALAGPRDEIESRLTEIWSEVLGIEKNLIGLNDDFFELGGHSLKATIMISKLHKVLNLKIPLAELFRTPTIRKLAEYVRGLPAVGDRFSTIEPVEKKEYYPLSSAQKRLYILQQMELEGTSYNTPKSIVLEGALDKEKLEGTFNELITCHESLRTSVEIINETPVQIIHDDVEFEIEYISVERGDATIQNFIRPFDLSHVPLLRVGLIKTEEARHILMVDLHHIITDGISQEILTKEFMSVYGGEELPHLRLQYKDYAEWQNRREQQESMKQQEEYWAELFSDELPLLNLPTDYSRPLMQSFEGNSVSFILNEEETRGLKNISKEVGATLYISLLSVFNILLSKLSGQEDIIVGAPLAARRHADLEHIIGMFVNSLAMRNYPSGRKTFREFLKEVKEQTLKTYENQEYQFEDLVEKISVRRDPGRNPVFDVMFNLLDQEEYSEDVLLIDENSDHKYRNLTSKFDLLLTVVDYENKLYFNFGYCTKLFKEETIERFIMYLKKIVNAVIEDPHVKISDIEIIMEQEKRQVLYEFNDTVADYPKEKTLHRLFEEQVEKTPDKPALVFEEEKVTYRVLNERANQLARELRDRGVKTDAIVGIMVQRCADVLIVLLGILKAGGAYLPIDPDYPGERQIYLLKDGNSRILVTQRKYKDQIKGISEVIDIESDEIYKGNGDNLEGPDTVGNLAYVIYTSGSTGKPKGVMVDCRNVIRLVKNTDYVEFREDDRILQTGALEFDASTFEIWGALLNGLMLHIVAKDKILAPGKLGQVLKRERISTMWLTSPLFNQLANQDVEIFAGLVNLLVGGDVLSPAHINRVRSRFPGLHIINGYGPTENTTFSTTFLVDKDYEESIPIGSPINNSFAYILDASDRLVPIGVAGELYVGGDGLSRGYLNNPELTAEKFVDYRSYSSKKIYKTGDLARWLPDGNIEFLGRIDHQVKIRGYRIELGEIENHLLNREEIKEAVVLAKEQENGDKYLCAYIIPQKEFEVTNLKKYLLNYLPDYMLPSYFVQLDRLPLTPNGKVDIKALPEPELKVSEAFVGPRDEIEKKLVKIWSEVLGIDVGNIGIDFNFFELGGHSLKATTLAYQVCKELKVNVKIKDIFTHPTIRELARQVKESRELEYIEISLSEEKEYYELSYAQRRLWILCQFEEDSTAYNMPAAAVVSRSFDVDAFTKAVQTLADRHESFRTVFIPVKGNPRQKIIKDFKFNLEQVDFRALDEEIKEKRTREIYRKFANRPFNLEHGPLFGFKTVRWEDEKYLLFLNFHHIISDGWSMGITNNELMILYNAFLKGSENPLPPLKLQYKDYTLWHNRLIEAGTFSKSRHYWLEKFKNKPNGIELPLDHPRKPIQTFNGGRVSFTIDKEKILRLRQLNLQEDATLFMSLITLLSIFLYKYSGQEDIIIGFPIAGRKRTELNHMIGFLVNTMVFRIELKPAESFREMLGRLKQETLTCYEYQDYPFDLLVEELGLDRDLSQSPLFNVMLAHNNADTLDIEQEVEGVGLSGYSHSDEFNMSKFDLIFFMDEYRDKVQVKIEYNSDLFEHRTIERMAGNFLSLADKIIDSVDASIYTCNPISPREYERVIEKFNDTRYKFPGLNLQQLFENQVQKSAEKTAAVYDGDKITYEDLNRKVNQLAHYLREVYKVKPNNIIGISVDRSIDMIVIILGIMKSGAGFLAVDPTYPRDRVLHVLAHSQAGLLIIDKVRPELLGEYRGELLDIDTHRHKISRYSPENPPVVNNPPDILYVNYTSGSTGIPNGAMLSHDILTNLINWQNERTSIDCSLHCLQFTSINFCVSFQEIISTLTSGGELHLVGDIERQDIDYLMDFLSKYQIEILFLPFSYLNFLFNESCRWNRSFNHNLKHIITAGEQLKITTGLKRFLDSNPGIQLHNHYGSTEMHVVTSYTLDASTAGQTPIPPAGKPISNVKIYILDEYNNPVPIGVWGELFVSGSSEILGYIDNTDLTEKKLLNHPVLSEDNKRLYRTGDIGRWHEDGNIELRGRKDFQVKIRGFRVEPGEIESKILSIDRIRECVVTVKEDGAGQKFLVAYVVVDNIEISTIKKILSNDLPQFMVPQLIVLENLPLMPNGKVDRENLPEPELGVSAEYVGPRNEMDEVLLEIWSEILGAAKNKISIDINFFDMGGHSLKATLVVTTIHKRLGKKVPLAEMFKRPTIRELSDYIERAKDYEYSPIEPVEEKDAYGLSSAQKRLYVVQQMEPDNISYNMPLVLILEGKTDEEILASTFRLLVQRHESLRTSFHIVGEEPVQKVHENIEFKIAYVSVERRAESADIIQNFVRSFDLSQTPLLRAGLIRLEDEKHILMVDMHHIITDGTSMDLLVSEFKSLYTGEEPTGLKLQYRDYVCWQNSEEQREAIKQQETYWMKQFEGEIPVLNLPTDYPRPAVQSFEGNTLGFGMSIEHSRGLNDLALHTGTTLYMVLLAIYNILLSKISGQEDIIVGTDTAGRRHADLQPIIGMFVNTLAIRNYPQGERTFKDFLIEVKERTLTAFENQEYQFEDLVGKLNVNRDPSRNPLFDVMFALPYLETQTEEITGIEIPGLRVIPYESENLTAKFDINLTCIKSRERLFLTSEYCSKLFREETIKKFMDYFMEIVETVIRSSDIKIKDISISHDLLTANTNMGKVDFGF
jgi:tyrocidine synthetase-3